MTHDEMRLCRRELINQFLHNWHFHPEWNGTIEKLQSIKECTRIKERVIYGHVLNAYSQFKKGAQ